MAIAMRKMSVDGDYLAEMLSETSDIFESGIRTVRFPKFKTLQYKKKVNVDRKTVKNTTVSSLPTIEKHGSYSKIHIHQKHKYPTLQDELFHSEESEFQYTNTFNSPSRILSDVMEQRIISHLRKRLNRRLEKRMHGFIAEEMTSSDGYIGIEDDEGHPEISARPTSRRIGHTILNNYNEQGDKIVFNGGVVNGHLPTVVERQPTEISLKSALKKPNSTPSIGKRQVSLVGMSNDLSLQDSSDEYGDDEIKRMLENGEIDFSKFIDLPISPVPTPMVYRPATRENNRLSYEDSVNRVLMGSLNVKCPADVKILRLYVGSAFTDSDVERGYLMQKVYPNLKTYCRTRGYEIQVMDLHWAMRDWVTDDHMILEASQKILERCIEDARCVSFLMFFGQKCGPEILPASIPAEEFEAIVAAINIAAEMERVRLTEKAAVMLQQRRRNSLLKRDAPASDADGKQKHLDTKGASGSAITPAAAFLKRKLSLVKTAAVVMKVAATDIGSKPNDFNAGILHTWYRLDENVVPPVYRLQKISTHINDFARNDEIKKRQAKITWMNIQKRLLNLFQKFAPQVISNATALKKYSNTVFELELENGLFNADNPDDICYVIRRTIPNINLQDQIAKDFVDVDANGSIDNNMKDRLEKLQQNLKQKIPFRSMRDYEINWSVNGIEPSLRPHGLYLDKMCIDFLEIMTSRLDSVIKNDNKRRDENIKLFEEVAEHVKFDQERSRSFQGRKELLSTIKRYMRSTYRMPLIIHGTSGCGKTSLMAKAAKETYKWFKRNGVAIVVRFVGVTSSSTNIRELLTNITQQISYIYGVTKTVIPEDFRGIVNEFSERIKLASSSKPLVIYIDSLNQLSDENDAKSLSWLPRDLPDDVHIVVSTLPDAKYEAFPQLQKLFAENPDSFVEVPPLHENDAIVMLDHWLNRANRTLTFQQYDIIIAAFKQCPYPLQLKISFDESMQWCSYTPEERLKINPTIKKAITMLFARMEVSHGEPLVRRALGYITAARNGITENEMLDLLSLDDAVMDDITSQLKPRVRRCPMISWTRLRTDLNDYLVERSADNCKPLRWFQSQFQEAAEERYLKSKDKAPSYHKAIAEYFMGAWETGKPIGNSERPIDRFIMEQPLYWELPSADGASSRIFNHRKLSELPSNLLKAQLFNEMKSKTLCNFEFLLAKICGQSLRAVMEDFQMALIVEPHDIDLKLISDCLNLSSKALSKDPRQLATQITARINDFIMQDKPVAPGDPKKYPYLHQLYWDARRASVPSIIPSMSCMTPPGGIMFDLLSGHKGTLTAISGTAGGLQALTSSRDNTMKLWDLKSGNVKKTIPGVGENVLAIRTAKSNTLAITSETTCIRIWEIKRGICMHVIDDYVDPASITTAKDENYLVAFYDGTNMMRTWNLEGEFEKITEVQLSDPEGALHKDRSITVAPTSYGECVLYAFRSSSVALVHNAITGEQTRTLQPPTKGASVTSVALSRDYYVVACRYQHNNDIIMFQLELYDVTNGKYVRSIRGCVNDDVRELVINESGSHGLCVCTSEQTNTSDIAAWNLETEDHKHIASHANVSTLCACVDLRYTLTGSKYDSSLCVWNLSATINKPGTKLTKKSGMRKIYVMKDYPQYVVTQSFGSGDVSVWNMSRKNFAGERIRLEKGIVMSMHDVLLFRNTKAVILADRGISTVTEDEQQVYQTLYVYDLVTRKFERKIKDCFIYPSPPHEYAVLSNDRLMGFSENRSHFIVWNLKNGHIVYRVRPNFRELERRKIEMGIIDEDDGGIARKKRGTTAKMTPWDRRTETKSARERRRQAELDDTKRIREDLKKEKENAIDQYIMSGDEKIVVASFFAHHLCVFDIESQKHVHTLEDENSMLFLYVAALTYDGGHLVHTNYDEESKVSFVTLWNCKTGELKRRLKNEKNVSAIAINNSGQRVVFGKDRNEMRVWEPQITGSLRKIKGYKNMRFDVDSRIVLLNDGARAAVFAGDISLWDIDRGVLLSVFSPDINIQCFNIAFDGQLLVFGMRDSPNLVSMRLSKKHRLPITNNTPNQFNEEDESSDESEDEDYA